MCRLCPNSELMSFCARASYKPGKWAQTGTGTPTRGRGREALAPLPPGPPGCPETTGTTLAQGAEGLTAAAKMAGACAIPLLVCGASSVFKRCPVAPLSFGRP